MKYCKICGLITREDAQICPSCGNPLVPLQLIYKDKRIRKRILLILLVVCLLISSCIAVFISLHNRLTKKEAQEIVNNVLLSIYEEEGAENFIAQATKDRVQIHVDKVFKQDGTYYADCTVSTVDIVSVLKEITANLSPSDVSTYEEVTQMLTEQIQQGNTITQNFTIHFLYFGEQYVAIFPDEMVSFCLGNLEELLPFLIELTQGV